MTVSWMPQILLNSLVSIPPVLFYYDDVYIPSPLWHSILFCSPFCFLSFIFQDGIPPSLAIAGAPYFNNKEGTQKDAILPKSPVGRYIQPISGKNIDRLKQHYNRANPADRTRSQMARAALEESEEDSGEEDANSPANDSGDYDYHTSDADEVRSLSSINIFINIHIFMWFHVTYILLKNHCSIVWFVFRF